MIVECVLDASVAAAAFFQEAQSASAQIALTRVSVFHAPEFILLEIGNIAAKKFKRGEVTEGLAGGAVTFVERVVGRFHADHGLADRASQLALIHGVTSYDACYVALAERLGVSVLTADLRLVQRCIDSGLGGFVQLLT